MQHAQRDTIVQLHDEESPVINIRGFQNCYHKEYILAFTECIYTSHSQTKDTRPLDLPFRTPQPGLKLIEEDQRRGEQSTSVIRANKQGPHTKNMFRSLDVEAYRNARANGTAKSHDRG